MGGGGLCVWGVCGGGCVCGLCVCVWLCVCVCVRVGTRGGGGTRRASAPPTDAPGSLAHPPTRPRAHACALPPSLPPALLTPCSPPPPPPAPGGGGQARAPPSRRARRRRPLVRRCCCCWGSLVLGLAGGFEERGGGEGWGVRGAGAGLATHAPPPPLPPLCKRPCRRGEKAAVARAVHEGKDVDELPFVEARGQGVGCSCVWRGAVCVLGGGLVGGSRGLAGAQRAWVPLPLAPHSCSHPPPLTAAACSTTPRRHPWRTR